MLTQKEYFEALDKIQELDKSQYIDEIIERNDLMASIIEYENQYYANGIPPDILANALQDPIHKNSGDLKAAKSIKVKK